MTAATQGSAYFISLLHFICQKYQKLMPKITQMYEVDFDSNSIRAFLGHSVIQPPPDRWHIGISAPTQRHTKRKP